MQPSTQVRRNGFPSVAAPYAFAPRPIMASPPAVSIDPLLDPRWRALTDRHPKASVFHTPEWLRSLKITYAYRPIAFVTELENGQIESGIVCCDVDSWLTGRRLVSLPFSDHCEPLVEGPEALHSLLDRIKAAGSQRSSYIELRPRSEHLSGSFEPAGFGVSHQYVAHTLDLSPPLETIYGAFHKDSVQRKIRRSEREGLIYREGRSEEFLNDFYRLLVLTRRRHQLPPQPINWFRNLATQWGDRLKIRLAGKGSEAIAAILTVRFRGALVYKYGCSDARFNNLGGMALLFWRAIQEAKQEGLEEFDLGRSDLDQPGLITFKDRWGAKRSMLTYFRCPPVKRGFHGAGRRAQFAKQIISHSPNRALVIAGRLLYRHIG